MNESEAREEFHGFMRELESEPEHVLHVAKLALQLFDELYELHRLSADDRLILEAAACLHDIGWAVSPGGREHHKASARLIRERPWRSFDANSVAVLAQVARYHRHSLPDSKHKEFQRLRVDDRNRVERLAALLRIADGLDRRHRQYVLEVKSTVEPGKIMVHLITCEFADCEIQAAKKKSDLARTVFGREFVFTAELR